LVGSGLIHRGAESTESGVWRVFPIRGRGEERPGALLARRTHTMKLCSSDARSKGSLATPLKRGQGSRSSNLFRSDSSSNGMSNRLRHP
jgi:hypothetical protein